VAKVTQRTKSKKASAASRVAKKAPARNSERASLASRKDSRQATPAKTSKAAKNTMPKNTAQKTAPKVAAKTVVKAAAKPVAKPAPVKAAAKPVLAAKPVAPLKAPVAKAVVAAKPVAGKPVVVAPKGGKPVVKVEEPRKPATQRQGFKTNEFVVYPAHGVGQILAIEEQEIAGARLELFVINFIKDKMTLRVPTSKIANVGMRKLSEPALVKKALETLKGRARIKRTMWSRRAQEYEAKINSGDIVAIAEVVRDLFRSESQPEQSYSERQLYEAALDRLSREIAAVQHVTETEAIKEVEAQLAKGPRRGPKVAEAEGAEGEAEGEAEAESDGDDTVTAEDEAA
jgi:CarD family transcriptional regulator